MTPRTCERCGAELDDDALFCPADGTHFDRRPADPLLGTVIAGDIVLTSVIGSGAMGRVYRGSQRSIGRDVAVKVLHPDLSANRQITRRFEREARIASRIRHPHVVEVYLAGRLASGALYTVMELLDGVSLAGALAASGGAMPLERALRITMQICKAVGEAHACDVVHRDLKPENIMLVRRSDAVDWVKLLDFGIAKANVDGLTMETAPGLVFGTARYISPEGARGGTVGPASDVYSLATILFEMLAGHPPFVVDSAMALLVKHLHEAPPELLAEPRALGVSAAVARVVMDNLAKSPADRAPDARAFGFALANAARDAGVVLDEPGIVYPASVADNGVVAARVDVDAPTVAGDPPSSAPITTLGGTIGSEAPAPPPSRWSGRATIALTLALGAATTLAVEWFLLRNEPEPTALTVTALRSAAAHDLLTRAMAAREGGDVEGARQAALAALERDPASGSARLLAEQYTEDVRALGTPTGATVGPPRVIFEAPAHARVGETTSFIARVLPRSAGATAPIGSATLTLLDVRGAPEGRALPIRDLGGGRYESRTVLPATGRRFVVFRVSVAGRRLSAERGVDVEAPETKATSK